MKPITKLHRHVQPATWLNLKRCICMWLIMLGGMIYMAKPLVPKLSLVEVAIPIGKLKKL